MEEKLIQTHDIAKAYHHKFLFQHVNLTILRGQCLAFMGHNGCGKSTLLKILAQLITVSAGKIEYMAGIKFGYVPEHFPKINLTATQYIRHMARIEGLTSSAIQEKSDALFSSFFMHERKDVPMKHLSKGTLQKVGVVQALMAANDVLLLDEPLSGQDAASQQEFVRRIRALRESGVTVLLACHEKRLARALADRLYEIADGTVREASLAGQGFTELDILFFDAPPGCAATPPVSSADVAVDVSDERVKITVAACRSSEIIVQMIQHGYQLRELQHERDW